MFNYSSILKIKISQTRREKLYIELEQENLINIFALRLVKLFSKSTNNYHQQKKIPLAEMGEY